MPASKIIKMEFSSSWLFRAPFYSCTIWKTIVINAYAHGLGFERVLQLPEFDELSKKRDSVVKPVLIFTVDGGPNENPRYQKKIEVGVHHYLQNDLNLLFIATNAPERSAVNRFERKMAPLSRELSGLIIPHDNFGSPLDDQRITIDIES
jgi:hypothetical protein